MKKWEYCEIFIWRYDTETFYRWRNDNNSTCGKGFKSSVDVLNWFGEQGWELASSGKGYNVFKRELVESELNWVIK